MAEAAMAGNRRAIARLITHIENEHPGIQDTLADLYPHTGQAQIIGITGAPGTGKSTLVNALAKAYRDDGLRVGVVAVDASSPFSGGAILGDRVRMRDLSLDPQVFVRSMATRGRLGGLAWHTADAVNVLDAAGFEIILVETVGTGQVEVDIAQMSHAVVVVDVPGLGDDIQAMKAGILEIADVFAVNKADIAGVEHTASALEAMLDLGEGRAISRRLHLGPLGNWMLDHFEETFPQTRNAETQTWRPPIVRTIAIESSGILELKQAIADFCFFLRETGGWELRDRVRLVSEIEHAVREKIVNQLLTQRTSEEMERLVQDVISRRLSPGVAAQQMVNRLL
jgi:LAO/AO transport system kinase